MALIGSRMAVVLLVGTGVMALAIPLCGQAQQREQVATKGTAAAKPEDEKPAGDTSEGKSRTAKSRSDRLTTQRFELIQRRVAAAEIRSDEAGFPTRFSANPIFRYSDPARGYVAAAVWKLGDEGRPKAILTSELDKFKTGSRAFPTNTAL